MKVEHSKGIWEEDLKAGEKGEEVWKEKFEKAEGIKIFKQEGYFKDYDFLDDRNVTYEIKTDSWVKKTKNIAIEVTSSVKNKTPGWIKYSKADFYVMVIDEDTYYCCPMGLIQRFYKNFGHNYKPRAANNNPDVRCIYVPLVDLPYNYKDFIYKFKQIKYNQSINGKKVEDKWGIEPIGFRRWIESLKE